MPCLWWSHFLDDALFLMTLWPRKRSTPLASSTNIFSVECVYHTWRPINKFPVQWYDLNQGHQGQGVIKERTSSKTRRHQGYCVIKDRAPLRTRRHQEQGVLHDDSLFLMTSCSWWRPVHENVICSILVYTHYSKQSFLTKAIKLSSAIVSFKTDLGNQFSHTCKLLHIACFPQLKRPSPSEGRVVFCMAKCREASVC